MQDRYAGDVGDFGKLGMLRTIASSGLRIGVNWYLVLDESHNRDGRHIGYLKGHSFVGCDDELLQKLGTIVKSGNRSVHELENAGLVPGASYYAKVLCPPENRDLRSRDDWHSEALGALKQCDLVFLDPDNGLLDGLKSVSIYSKASNKYVRGDEIAEYYADGKSVVFYSHRSRQEETAYLKRFVFLKTAQPYSCDAQWCALSFRRGTIRDYFFIMQPRHTETLRPLIKGLSTGAWGRHFKSLDI